MPPCGALRAADRTLSATSWRKAVLRAAASSNVSGGTRRVLARPGAEAFAMKAMPQAAGLPGVGVSVDWPATNLPLKRSARFMRCPRPEERQQRAYAGMPKFSAKRQSLPAHSYQVAKHRKVILFTKS